MTDPIDRELRELLRVRCVADGEELDELWSLGGGDDPPRAPRDEDDDDTDE